MLKKIISLILVIVLCFSITACTGEQGPKGDKGDKGDATTLVSLVKTDTDGLKDTYTLTFSDGSVSTFTVTNGTNGTNGATPYIGENGNWFIGDKDTGILAKGTNGADGGNGANGTDGEDGVTPNIGENGNWWVGDYDTGVLARGTDGSNGTTPHIGANGNWYIGTEDLGVVAKGSHGTTPNIGENGNWFIGTTDTGVKAEGVKGDKGDKGDAGTSPEIKEGIWWIGTFNTGIKAEGIDGDDGVTPHIGADGYWYVGDQNTEVKALGVDGTTPAIGDDGYWYIGLENTGVKAAGSISNKLEIKGGTWWIDDVDTGIQATGSKGDDGKDGVTPHVGEDGYWYFGDQKTNTKAAGSVPTIGDNGHWFVDGVDTGFYAGYKNPAKLSSIAYVADSENPLKFEITYDDSTKKIFSVQESGDDKAQVVAGYATAQASGYTGTLNEWIIASAQLVFDTLVQDGAAMEAKTVGIAMEQLLKEYNKYFGVEVEENLTKVSFKPGRYATEVTVAASKWKIGLYNTGIPSTVESPYVGANGNWWVKAYDLGVASTAELGKNSSGYWTLGGTATTIPINMPAPTVVGDTWWIEEQDTGIKNGESEIGYDYYMTPAGQSYFYQHVGAPAALAHNEKILNVEAGDMVVIVRQSNDGNGNPTGAEAVLGYRMIATFNNGVVFGEGINDGSAAAKSYIVPEGADGIRFSVSYGGNTANGGYDNIITAKIYKNIVKPESTEELTPTAVNVIVNGDTGSSGDSASVDISTVIDTLYGYPSITSKLDSLTGGTMTYEKPSDLTDNTLIFNGDVFYLTGKENTVIYNKTLTFDANLARELDDGEAIFVGHGFSNASKYTSQMQPQAGSYVKITNELIEVYTTSWSGHEEIDRDAFRSGSFYLYVNRKGESDPNNNKWMIKKGSENDVSTGVSVTESNGTITVLPEVKSGTWWIGETDTGINATGAGTTLTSAYLNRNISQAHGLTIEGYLSVTIDNSTPGNVAITISTPSGMFKTSAGSWRGRQGMVGACAVGTGLTLTDLTLRWVCKAYASGIWLYGDSYFDVFPNNNNNADRWPSYLVTDGYTDVLLSSYSGMSTEACLEQFKQDVEYGTPQFVVWCCGMNNSDKNHNEISTGYRDATLEMLAICEEKGITPILCTIPNTPGQFHTAKNNWIKASGYRYIDFSKAVGGDRLDENLIGTDTRKFNSSTNEYYDNKTGAYWYDGMLNSDEIHPDAKGAQALYARVLVDFPEITRAKTLP